MRWAVSDACESAPPLRGSASCASCPGSAAAGRVHAINANARDLPRMAALVELFTAREGDRNVPQNLVYMRDALEAELQRLAEEIERGCSTVVMQVSLDKASRGVFAAKPIPADTTVAVYYGKFVLRSTDSESQYLFNILFRDYQSGKLNHSYALDAEGYDHTTNPAVRRLGCAHLFNHACTGTENCVVKDAEVSIGSKAKMWLITFRTKRAIPMGAQLTIDYGADYVSPSQQVIAGMGATPVLCGCLAHATRGYPVPMFFPLKRRVRRPTARAAALRPRVDDAIDQELATFELAKQTPQFAEYAEAFPADVEAPAAAARVADWKRFSSYYIPIQQHLLDWGLFQQQAAAAGKRPGPHTGPQRTSKRTRDTR